MANRHAQGGHDVPSDKIVSRYSRSIAQLKDAIPHLSRAYVFDNSGSEMRFLGEYAKESGWIFAMPIEELPDWFVGGDFQVILNHPKSAAGTHPAECP